MKNLIGQKNNDSAKQPSSDNEMMYGCSVGASSQELHGMPSHVEDANQTSEPCNSGEDKSAGKEKALVVGCNANNDNASALKEHLIILSSFIPVIRKPVI